MKLYEYAKAFSEGAFDGTDERIGNYVVLRYMNAEPAEPEEQEPLINNPDWYAVAWVSLLQVFPDAKIAQIILQPGFPAMADHVKYWLIVAEAEELLQGYNFYNTTVRATTDGDVVLCKFE